MRWPVSSRPILHPASGLLADEGTSEGRLARAAIGISLLVVLAKLFGFGEKVIVARLYGASWSSDVYFGVMGIVWSIVFLAKELIYPSVLPVLSRTLSGDGTAAAWLFGRVFRAVLLSMSAVALVILIGGRWIVSLFLPGFSMVQAQAAANLIRTLVPGMMCLVLMMLTYTCLNARKRFLVSALGETMFRLSIVVGLLIFTSSLGLYAVSLTVGVGSGLCLLFHLLNLPDRRWLLQRLPKQAAAHETAAVVRLMKALVVGVVFSHIGGLVDNALASRLPEGQLSALTYGKKIVDAVVLIGPVAIVTVMYSQVAHLRSAARHEDIANLIGKAVRVLLYVGVPAACLVVELRLPVVRLLFQRGQFGDAEALVTSVALGVYGCGLITFAVESLLVYAFYGMADTRTPVAYGVVFVVVDIVLAIALVGRYEYIGIAGALVLAKSMKIVALGWVLSRRLGTAATLETVAFALKLLAATSALLLATKLTVLVMTSPTTPQPPLLIVGLPAMVGLTCYVACSYCLKLREHQVIMSAVRSSMSVRRFWRSS